MAATTTNDGANLRRRTDMGQHGCTLHAGGLGTDWLILIVRAKRARLPPKRELVLGAKKTKKLTWATIAESVGLSEVFVTWCR